MSQKAENKPANTEIKVSNGVLSGFGQVVFYPVNLVKVLIQVKLNLSLFKICLY